jgi:hypothetical protein
MSSNQTDPNDPPREIAQGLELRVSNGVPQIIPVYGSDWLYRSYDQETDYQEKWFPVFAWVILPDEHDVNGRPMVRGVYADKHGQIKYTNDSGELKNRQYR